MPSLGNHDDAALQRNLQAVQHERRALLHLQAAEIGVRFFALDSNYVDKSQLDWLDKQLAASGSDWKIMFFHHPLYSSGETHGSAELQRGLLEPVFLKYGVNVVLTGHEHFYERIKPQKGIAVLHRRVVGEAPEGRPARRSDLTAYGNDTDYAFMLMEIVGDELFFQTINQKGVDASTPAASSASARSNQRRRRTTQPVVPQAKPSPIQPGPRQSK